MTVYVLDSSALIRYIDGEAGADRVNAVLKACVAGKAAGIKVDRKVSYADAFALELAMSFSDHVLVTADYDFESVSDLARIEFLPSK